MRNVPGVATDMSWRLEERREGERGGGRRMDGGRKRRKEEGEGYEIGPQRLLNNSACYCSQVRRDVLKLIH